MDKPRQKASFPVYIALLNNKYIITPHAQRERGKVIDVSVLIYIYMLWTKKIYYSPFQTFAVGLLVEFIDCL